MNRVGTERQKNLVIAHSKPYETLAEYIERRVREDMCVGCFGAANNDCEMCRKASE